MFILRWQWLKGLVPWYMARIGLMLGALAKTLEKDAWAKLGKEVQAFYVEKDGKYVLDLEGEEDTSGLKSALEKERTGRKAAERLFKELQTQFEGLDPEVIREMMKKFDNDDDAKLIKAGKLDEVVAKRVEKMRAENDKQVKVEQGKTAKEKARADKFLQRVLENTVRAAATKAGLHPHAVDDAILRARQAGFTVNDDGEAVQLDEGGQVKLGKDGKSPYSPMEWLEGMKEGAPHWFVSGSSGGGASGAGAGRDGKRNVKRGDFDKSAPVEKQNILKDVKEGKAVLVD
jgi:hypothetical protein